MKTVKIILSAAIVALTVYSCSSDRDDEVRTEQASKLNLKPLGKENSNNQETAKESDTVIIGPTKGSSTIGLDPDPNPEPDPNEGGDPKGLPPRH